MSISILNQVEKNYINGLLQLLGDKSPFVRDLYLSELENQRNTLKLIASENYSSLAVQASMGSIFTDKYAEGVPYHRFYSGCENVDKLEDECQRVCRELFGAEFAYVQPHSGADANLIAYWAILNYRVTDAKLNEFNKGNIAKLSQSDFEKIRHACHNQRLLALDYYSGGHLTHGYRMNLSAQMFDVRTYGVSADTYLLDYDDIEKKAEEFSPLILLSGYSAYSRRIDFSRLRKIADKVGAILMVDMAHFAGLVAGGVFNGCENPVEYADIVTATTHKTLRGPRGGFILSKKYLAPSIEKGCPLVMGGPLEHVIAAKLIAFREAMSADFKSYAFQIVENSRALASELVKCGVDVLTGGSDNHMVIIDCQKSFHLNGRQAESTLRRAGIMLNRNAIPFDQNGPWYTSGLRLGTAALTTRGMKESEMRKIAHIIYNILSKTFAPNSVKGLSGDYIVNDEVIEEGKRAIRQLLEKYPLYPYEA